MIRLFTAIVAIIFVIGCDSSNTKTDEIQVVDDETSDTENPDAELTFELSQKVVDIKEKTSRDIISCGDAVILCGESSGKGYIIAYKDGVELWNKTLESASVQSINALTCGKNNNIYAVGDHSLKTDSPLSGFIQALDINGEILWEKELDNQKAVSIYAVTTDSSGNIFVGGRVDGAFENTVAIGDKDGFIAKYLENGVQAFITQIGTPVFDSIQGIAIGSDGFILASGHTAGNIETGTSENDSESGMKGFVIKLNPDGTPHWKKLYDCDMFWDISVFITGSFFIAGNIVKDGKSSAVIFQAGLDGNIKSIYNIIPEKNITPTGIAFDKKKNLYLTGFIEGNFTSESKIPPVKTAIKAGNNVFIGVFNPIGAKLLYSGILGGDFHDINPRIAVDSSFTPNILYYSVENLTDSSGTATMIRFERK